MLAPHDYVKPTISSSLRASTFRESGVRIMGQSRVGRRHAEISPTLRSNRLRSRGGYETLSDIQREENEQESILSKVDQVLQGLHQHASEIMTGANMSSDYTISRTTDLDAIVKMVEDVLPELS